MNELTMIKAKYNEIITDKIFLNQLIIVTFFLGIFLNGIFNALTRLFKIHSYSPLLFTLIFILIPSFLAILLYVRFNKVSIIELIFLLLGGIISNLAGIFLAFLATMDIYQFLGTEPFLMNSFSLYELLMWEFLITTVKYLMHCGVISSIYVLHARFKDDWKISLPILLMGFPAIPIFISFGYYFLAREFGI